MSVLRTVEPEAIFTRSLADRPLPQVEGPYLDPVARERSVITLKLLAAQRIVLAADKVLSIPSRFELLRAQNFGSEVPELEDALALVPLTHHNFHHSGEFWTIGPRGDPEHSAEANIGLSELDGYTREVIGVIVQRVDGINWSVRCLKLDSQADLAIDHPGGSKDEDVVDTQLVAGSLTGGVLTRGDVVVIDGKVRFEVVESKDRQGRPLVLRILPHMETSGS